MPREQINHPSNEVPKGEKYRERIVHVVWYANTVQIELEADPMDFRTAGDPDSLTTGLFSPGLCRSEVNQMIRALRRARDKVFGSDA